MKFLNWVKKTSPSSMVGSCFVLMSFLVTLFTSTNAQAALAGPLSFGLDNNPADPVFPGGQLSNQIPPMGPIPGRGAENPFGLGLTTPVAPSPSLTSLPNITRLDGAILSPGLILQHRGPAGAYSNGGFYVDSLSSNHIDTAGDILIKFSVDRFSPGMSGTAVNGQFTLGQQPGDIFESTKSFTNPLSFRRSGIFIDAAGTFAGTLPSAGGAAGSNILFIDEGPGTGAVPGLGLVTAGGSVDETGMGGIISAGSHDNVDSFDLKVFDVNPDFSGAPFTNTFDIEGYFTLYPDEALGTSSPVMTPADIYAVIGDSTATFAPGTIYATAASMGLDGSCVFDHPSFENDVLCDSIDALVMFDDNLLPDERGSNTAQAGIDAALFSLAPGSPTLVTHGLSDADVFFTDFTGKFWRYATASDLGLIGVGGGPVRPIGGQLSLKDNIDALEINIAPPVVSPNPSTSLLWVLLGLLLIRPIGNKVVRKLL